METFKWKTVIKQNIFVLKIVGLWPKGNESYKWNLYTLYSLTVLNVFVNIPNIFQLANIYFVYTDLEAVADIIFIIVTEILTSIKTCYFICNMQKLKKIMVSLETRIFLPKNLQQLVEPSVNFWKFTYKAYYFPVIIHLLTWALFPIMDGSVHESRLPMSAWFPFNTKISPYYEITYVYQMMGISVLAFTNLNMDTFIAALMLYVGTQCEILCDRLKNCGKSGAKYYNSNLLECVKHHRKIISYAESCNKFFDKIVLGQFFTSVLVLGFSMFQLTLVDPLSSQSCSLLFYAIAMAMEIFLYCWFGNEVEIKDSLYISYVQSSQIPYSTFASDWTGIPIEAKKNLIIFVMRAQKPIKMTAINLFSLSLATFTAILRTSWSYFAVLRQVNAQD